MAYTTLQMDYIRKCANRHNIEPEKVLAFLEVETGNQVFAVVYGKQEPLIRFEGHYFRKFLKGAKLERAKSQGLVGSVGEVKNPSSQTPRYDRLEQCKKIDYDAAVMSHSWGIGQVMGSHWSALGYSSPRNFEAKLRGGFEGQMDAVMLFLANFEVIPHLRRGDWSAVARLYNGPQFAKNKYDTKMQAAYNRLKKNKPAAVTSSGMVRAGSKGAMVREVQNLLKLQGYNINVDGDFGKSTQDAVRLFQVAQGLEADGVVGPRTFEKLRAGSTVSSEELSAQPVRLIKEVQTGVLGGIGGGMTLQAAKSTIMEASSYVASVPGLEAVSAILSAATAALVIGGLIYGLYGFVKSKRTNLGTA